jgi:hypothetical protein
MKVLMFWKLLRDEVLRSARLARDSRNVVVDGREGAVCSSHLATGIAQSLERLWGSNFVNKVAIDVEESIASSRVDDVVVKDFVVERAGGGCWGGHSGGLAE